MKLLVITSNLAHASFRLRVSVYLDTLRGNGIESEVVCLPAGFLARRKLFKKAASFDGVFLHKKSLNVLDAIWLSRYARKIIYDFDDAIMFSDKHPEKVSTKRQNAFRRTVRLADLVIADTSRLAEYALCFNQNVEVLTTGLNVSDYSLDARPTTDGKIRLVWIGSKSTLPYLADIRPAIEEVAARFDNVILRIVCDDFFDLKNVKVEKCLWSLETQAKDLIESDIGLAPMPDNNFTRGRLCYKILQYYAASLPVVASPVGANRECVHQGVTGFLASDNSAWVDKLSRLIQDSKLRAQMGQAAKAEVRQYDLKVIGNRLFNVVEKCLLNGKEPP